MLSVRVVRPAAAASVTLPRRCLSTTPSLASMSDEHPQDGLGTDWNRKWDFGTLHLKNDRYLREQRKQFMKPFRKKVANKFKAGTQPLDVSFKRWDNGTREIGTYKSGLFYCSLL